MRIFDTVKTAPLALKTRISPANFACVSGELLSLGFGIRFRAPGRSMHPTICHGDVITVAPVVPSNLKKGDIILYRFQSTIIAHRIVDIEKRNGRGHTFILRGDASTTCDDPVELQQVLGKVVCVERGHRRIDPYSRRVRLWHMLYLGLARVRRGAVQWFFPQRA